MYVVLTEEISYNNLPLTSSGLEQIHMGSRDIWRPDIHLYNNADGANMEHFGDIYFLVYRSGTDFKMLT